MSCIINCLDPMILTKNSTIIYNIMLKKMQKLLPLILFFWLFSPSLKAELPNFIIIFTDDQGYEDIGCFGSPKIKTPHLDKMATEGRKFTSFYSANSVCSPSRAALMTGSYPTRVSVPGVLFPRHEIGSILMRSRLLRFLKAKDMLQHVSGNGTLAISQNFFRLGKDLILILVFPIATI